VEERLNHLKIKSEGRKKMIGIVLIIVLILLVLGGLPNWGYHSYGWRPSGVLGTILIIVLILYLLGKL
jgi:hypothetical protein